MFPPSPVERSRTSRIICFPAAPCPQNPVARSYSMERGPPPDGPLSVCRCDPGTSRQGKHFPFVHDPPGPMNVGGSRWSWHLSAATPRLVQSENWSFVMADDKNKTAADGRRIDVHETYEIGYWSRKFGVTREELSEAVQKVGTRADDTAFCLFGFLRHVQPPNGSKNPRHHILPFIFLYMGQPAVLAQYSPEIKHVRCNSSCLLSANSGRGAL